MVKVIYEDKEILVLDKPADLVVTSSQTQKAPTLSDLLIDRFGIGLDRGGVVHRLDKDTSGLILVAKTQQALERLQLEFQERQVKKEYVALVHGFVKKMGVVETSLGRNPANREKFTVLEEGEGKKAVTEYEPIQRLAFSDERLVEIFSDLTKPAFRKLYATRYPNYTLVRVKPHTGRTHQIRVHLKYIGHPIVADEKYGGRKVVRLDYRWCPRQFLHAKKLGFYHPRSGEWMEMESELPKDLREVLANLTKTDG